jgi:hypothetical protein
MGSEVGLTCGFSDHLAGRPTKEALSGVAPASDGRGGIAVQRQKAAKIDLNRLFHGSYNPFMSIKAQTATSQPFRYSRYGKSIAGIGPFASVAAGSSWKRAS